MANLNEADEWIDGIYQLEEDDPVLGGPSGIDNRAPRELASRTRYQRLRSIAPWAATLQYPANVAYVSHGGATWKSVGESLDVAPGTDRTKWVRWAFTVAELQALLSDAIHAHQSEENPHAQYATEADLREHSGGADPHPIYALRGPIMEVPKGNVGPVITVQTPHIRQMVWNGAMYVRAPWHQPGMVLYSYDNASSISGYLPVRADLAYEQSNYPDLVARLGLSGAGTFSLVELRGEFIRCLDNGRGVNASRVLHSAEAGGNAAHTHGVKDPTHGHPVNDPGHHHGGWTDHQGNHTHRVLTFKANDFNSGTRVTGTDDVYDGGSWVDGTEAAGSHGHNVGISPAKTGIGVSASLTGISINAEGSEARPRNVAFPAWVSY